VLNQYPLPNLTQQLTQQPAVKLNYQATQKLRFSAKYDGQIARSVTTPGYNAYVPYPWIANEGATVTYVISPTAFIGGTYGRIENQLAGGNESGIPTDPSSNRLTALPTFPELYSNAGVMNPGYYGYQIIQATKPLNRRRGANGILVPEHQSDAGPVDQPDVRPGAAHVSRPGSNSTTATRRRTRALAALRT